jgi:hypothetical protein
MINLRRHRRLGLSLVETLIALALTAGFFGLIYGVYSSAMRSYRLSAWKQERTRQIQRFWEFVRRPLEEGTNRLEVVGAPAKLIMQPRPLLYNSVGTGNGNVLAWQVDHFNPVTRLIEGPRTYLVEKGNHVVRLHGTDGGKVIVIDDVESITVSVTQIRHEAPTQPDAYAETLDFSPDPTPGEGCIVEISLILFPPPWLQNPNLRLAQNNKFKLAIGAELTANPVY